MKILVTGASGFVGSHVARLCVARGLDTFALVRPGSSRERLADVGGLTFVDADLEDPSSMRRAALEVRPDLAIHVAWRIAPDVHDALENADCIGGSLALLRGLAQVGTPRVVFVGTSLEYAPSEQNLAESGPVVPQNFYASCKHAVHEVARELARARSMSFAWARLFNVYGPHEYPWPFIPTVIRRLLAGEPCDLSDGHQVRGYMFVEDTAAALLALGLSRVDGAINVGSSEATPVREVALRIGDELGRSELLRFGAIPRTPRDSPRTVADDTRLREVVGFTPRVPLAQGLRASIDWWRARGSA